MIFADPAVDGVRVKLHDAESPVPTRLHAVNVPATPVRLKPIAPMSVPDASRGMVSVTVTLQFPPTPTMCGPGQETVVCVTTVGADCIASPMTAKDELAVLKVHVTTVEACVADTIL